ncbi:hypothetical protein BJF79_28445 [Actinomadura sp. CNU-125]|uniref:hypothetical protein n=1 Tax=Actinomadura sp. CNU-125 TaxID=1904961 RepID=UPI00095B4757|nr:hypothetical protein [Actinomadura sp. CNU-125]OLT37977.1 hypothetical protein BJF79_28445 [Actinomadura sp. CNU-125]
MIARPPRPGRAELTAEAFAAALVLIVALVLVRATPEPGPLDGLPDPPAGPGRVTAGPVTETLPKTCGLSAATVERLVRDPQMWKDGSLGACEWSSGRDEKEDRFLSVELAPLNGRSVAPDPTALTPGRSPVSGAMTAFAPKWSDVPPKAVTGLGDEALLQFSASAGATVVTRVGNTQVVVQYRDFESSFPEETARAAAFAAAAEIVTGLGARPARPAIAPAPRPTPARTIPDVCSSVSGGTLDRLMREEDVGVSVGFPASGGLPVEGAEGRGCTWLSSERELQVSVSVLPGTDLIDGTRQAVRQYEIRYLDAQAEETLSVHDRKRFLPVRDLGDQAFAAHVPGVVPATIVFRDGNVLAEITYAESGEHEPLDGRLALRGAYAAAQDLAEALSTD